MRNVILALVGCLAVVGWGEGVLADTYTFQHGFQVAGSENTTPYTGQRDTQLNEAGPDRNYGTLWPLMIRGPIPDHAMKVTNLFAFPLIQNWLPEGAQITSVRLGLAAYGVPEIDIATKIAPVLKEWVEGTGAVSTTAEATWLNTGTGIAWSGAGALGATGENPDRGEMMDEVLVSSSLSEGDVVWFDIDASVVQQWINTPSSNHGVVIWTDQVTPKYWLANSANTGGGVYPAQRPILEVTFVPEPATMVLFSMGLGCRAVLARRR